MKKHNQEARVERCKNARMFEYIPVDPYDVFESEMSACYQIHCLNGTSGFRSFSITSLGRHGLGFVGAKLLSPGLPAPTRSGRGGDRPCPKHFFRIRMDRAKFIPSQCLTQKSLLYQHLPRGAN